MDHQTDFLLSSIFHDIENDRLSNSIMLISADTAALNRFAAIISQALMCVGNHPPCGECAECRKVIHGNHVDVLKFPRENKTILTEEMLEIIEDVDITPYSANKKVYILSNFSSVDAIAQNKLLKTLEEPPQGVYFILLVSNTLKVLPTIKSRCRKVYLPGMEADELKKILSDVDAAEEIKEQAICFCDGSEAQARKLLEDKDFPAKVKLILDILLSLRHSKQLIKYSAQIYGMKDGFEDLLKLYLKVLQYVNYIKVGMPQFVPDKMHVKDYEKIAETLTVDAIVELAQQSLIVSEKVQRNCNFTAIVDSFLLEILGVIYKCR